MKILLTGATGFLGEYIIKELSSEYEIIAMGRNEEKRKNIENLGAQFVNCDFTDINECEKYFDGIDYVIHSGAKSDAWGDYESFYRPNVLGTENICKLSLKYNVKRIIHISSPSIYTKTCDRLGIKEDFIEEPDILNNYIKTKLEAEKVVEKYNKMGLYSVILRPRGIIGIGDVAIVPRLLRVNKKIGIPLVNGGKNIIDVTCVENVALSVRLALEAENVNGEVFNITNKEPIEFKKLVDSFFDECEIKPKYFNIDISIIKFIAAFLENIYKALKIKKEPAITRYSITTLIYSQTLSIDKAENMLGYEPKVSIAEGVSKFAKHYRGI